MAGSQKRLIWPTWPSKAISTPTTYHWLFDELRAQLLQVIRGHQYCQTAEYHTVTLRFCASLAKCQTQKPIRLGKPLEREKLNSTIDYVGAMTRRQQTVVSRNFIKSVN